MENEAKSGTKALIIVALIGFFGVIGAALIGILPQYFPSKTSNTTLEKKDSTIISSSAVNEILQADTVELITKSKEYYTLATKTKGDPKNYFFRLCYIF